MMHDESQRQAKLAESALFIVREVTGASGLWVERIQRGVMTFKWRVTLPEQQVYVVRMYPPSRAHVVNYEPDIFRRGREKGIPLPQTICDSRTGPPAPLAYVVYRLIAGTPLSERLSSLSAAALQRVAKDLVAYLQLLQGVWVRGYGELVNSEAAEFSSWAQFVHTSFREGLSRAREYQLLPADEIARLRAPGAELERLDLQEPCGLAWGDLSPDNILVDSEDKISGLLDFEGVLAADFLANLGYCFSGCCGTRFLESILRVWPTPLTESAGHIVKLYAILRAVRILMHAHEPLPIGSARSDIKELLPGFRAVLDEIKG